MRTVWLLALALAGCGSDVLLGALPERGAGGDAGAAAGGSAGATGGSAGTSDGGDVDGGVCTPRPCAGRVYGCGDCEDDDGDGLIDERDDGCLGACDDTESDFGSGLPGQNNAPCRHDCYFDRDTGSGNDGCEWNHQCDPLSVAPAFPPSGDARCPSVGDGTARGETRSCGELRRDQSATCRAQCEPLTPNGCDCFGCCELPARSGRFVFIGRTPACSADALDDATRCAPCTPVPSCLNPCEACERCAGELAAPRCDGGPVCPSGRTSCAGNRDCGADEYCVSGCCVDVPR